MTVSSETARWDYVGNGTNDTFPFTSEIYDETDLKVYVDDIIQTVNVAYTIPYASVNNPAGGNVEFEAAYIPAADADVVILLDLPITQETDFVEGDKFPAESHETALDRLTKICQALRQSMDHAVRFSSYAATDLVMPDPSPGEYIGWNADGSNLENKAGPSVSNVTPWEIDALVTYGGGTAYTKATIDAALTAIGTSTKVTLILRPGNWTITASSDYSSYTNVIWRLPNGAYFTISSGQTLTIPSPEHLIVLPTQQIFTGNGSVVFSASGTAYPEWWGIDGTADQTEINKAFTALTSGGRVELHKSSYTVAAAITPTTKTTLFISLNTTVNLANGSNANMVSIAVNDVVVTGGGTIDGNGANQTATSSGISITKSRIKVQGVNIIECWWAGIVTEGLVGAHISDITIADNDISDCDADGITVGNYNDRVKIINNYIHGNGVSATGGNRRGMSTLQFVTDLLIQGNTVASNYENGIYIWTDCSGVRIFDNYVVSNNHFGIETASKSCIIKGNHVVGNGGQAVDDGGVFPYSYNIIDGNFIDANQNHGAYIYGQTGVIVANNLARNTINGGGTPYGIRFYDPTNCLAIGNICFDDQAPSVTQTWGMVVSEVGGVTATPLIGNILEGNTNNYLSGASEETPLVGNIQTVAGYELGARDRQTAYVATLTGNLAFDAAFYRTMLLNGGAADRTVNPSGTFRAGADIWVKNTGGTNKLTFDSTVLNQDIAIGEVAYFVYSGTAWVKMYLG